MIRFTGYSIVSTDLDRSVDFFSAIGFEKVDNNTFRIVDDFLLKIKLVPEASANKSLLHFLREFKFETTGPVAEAAFFSKSKVQADNKIMLTDKDLTLFSIQFKGEMKNEPLVESKGPFKKIHHFCVVEEEAPELTVNDTSMDKMLKTLQPQTLEIATDIKGVESHTCGAEPRTGIERFQWDDYVHINHIAIEVINQRDIALILLGNNSKPFQMDYEGNRKDITSADDLSFGIGSVFTYDPDGNLFEFLEEGKYNHEQQ